MMNRKLNLQLFAEPAPEQNNLTAEELQAQLAAANAQIAKLTHKADALASENATKTKKLREYLTEEEQEAEMKKAAEAERDRQFKEMQREIAVMSSVNTYMDTLEMSKEVAQQYAEARVDGDITRENEILRQHMKSFKANMMQSFLKSRGEVNAGHGSIEGESKAVQLAKSLPIYNNEVDESILKQYM